MALIQGGWSSMLLLLCLLLLMPNSAMAFGAGNIPSIATIEGQCFRHGDIEDTLKATLLFLHGKKWTTMLVQRTYFGNWCRDYSQAVDVGSLKGVPAETIRVLVWVLSFLGFGYATGEFEVTAERLGVYRPEEHIDNPLGYADGEDARKFDQRLRGPIDPRELDIDPRTGMKNYIANESGNWATSAGYLRWSFARSIHFGRLYTHGSGSSSGREEDLCEALRCLGQSLHCMEDFSAHSNYCELALRELGYHSVFAHCGHATEINLRGKRVFPLVTGTFGGVDFLHSVIGEVSDNLHQSEVEQLDVALKNVEESKRSGGDGTRGLFGSSGGGQSFIDLVGQVPGLGDGVAAEARDLQAASAAQEQQNRSAVIPGTNFDAGETLRKIKPILVFHDKIKKAINSAISKVPGLEKLIEHVAETLTAFVLGLIAPFIRPIINQVTKTLKNGSSGVISASAKAQLEPWNNPNCSNPTHSMLSKDHFTNILNPVAGRVATTVVQYVVPRILYAWDHPGVPVDEVVNDVLRAFHHPAARDEHVEIQRQMFNTVSVWAREQHRDLGTVLSSESVKNGKNHIVSGQKSRDHSHGGLGETLEQLGHGKVAGSLWSQVSTRDMGASQSDYLSPSPQPGPMGQRPPASPAYGYSQNPPPPGQGYNQPYPPQGGYGGPPQPQGYPQQPPPGGYYGGPPPPQPYGAPPPQYPPYGGQPPYGGYPGQY